MNQNEQSMLYPFRLSGNRMRQRAAQMRRQGQMLDALALVRRAAEQDDTPAAWHALAAELIRLGNWEAAVPLLSRVLSRDAHQPGAWLDMSRCMQALGQTELAVDCAYHQLQEDPWSQESDAARAILTELELGRKERVPRRTQKLIQRGLLAWQMEDRALGERRIHRALKLTDEKPRLLVTAAMLCMLELDLKAALGYLTRALRLQPDDARTLTVLATLCQQMEKNRLSRGFLQKAAETAHSVQEEDGFLTAAWAQDAWQETAAYLAARMKRWPCRISLLAARATMCFETGDTDEALQLWREILAVDPDERQAAAKLGLYQARQEHTIGLPGLPGLLPCSEQERQQNEFRMAAESMPLTELLQRGSRTRKLTDWMLESGDPAEARLAMTMLEGHSEPAVLMPYLREMLCRPFLHSEVRQWALVQLTEMGCREEMLIMTGSGYVQVKCQPLSERKQQEPWRIFLPLLLTETRHYRESGDIAAFAAGLWRCLMPQQQTEAVGRRRYAWCKAMEILYLRMTSRDERAARIAVSMPLSVRRISRVLRSIARRLDGEITG